MWEEDGWDGLAASFAARGGRHRRAGPEAREVVGQGRRSSAAAASTGSWCRRRGPARSSSSAPTASRGEVYAHELVKVRPGSAAELLERARDGAVPLLGRHGWDLIGAFTTAMVDDDEALLLWAIPSWQQWARRRARPHRARTTSSRGAAGVRDVVTRWHRILLVDAPLSPLRTGRQPSSDDRTDWEE